MSLFSTFLRRTEELSRFLGASHRPTKTHSSSIASGHRLSGGVRAHPANLKPNNMATSTPKVQTSVRNLHSADRIRRGVSETAASGSDVIAVTTEQYGSSASFVTLLLVQALLLKRIHFGKLSCQAQSLMNRGVAIQAMTRAKDGAGLMRALTKPAVEKRVVERVALKAGTYGRDPTVGSAAPG